MKKLRKLDANEASTENAGTAAGRVTQSKANGKATSAKGRMAAGSKDSVDFHEGSSDTATKSSRKRGPPKGEKGTFTITAVNEDGNNGKAYDHPEAAPKRNNGKSKNKNTEAPPPVGIKEEFVESDVEDEVPRKVHCPQAVD